MSPRTRPLTRVSGSIGISLGLALLIGISPQAFALNPDHKLTQYVHRIWQTQPGLPQSSIYAVAQTRDGYLWLGTESGIVRFDGVRFTPAPELDRASLGGIRAREFTQDSEGRIWIVSSDFGLVRVGEDGVKTFTARDGLPPGEINCAYADQADAVWVCTPSGMARFKGAEMQTYDKGLPGRPLAACQTPDGTIWTAGDGWNASWNESEFAATPIQSLPSGAGVRAMVCREDGVWIGTNHGLVHSDHGKERLYSKGNGLRDSVILSLAKGNHGELWIGTRNGFTRFKNDAFDSFSYVDGLSQNDVHAFYEDKEGSLWVATKHGLNQFLDGPATRFTRDEGLLSNNVGPVLADRSGDIWVGFVDGGLARWNGGRFSAVTGLASRKVTSLMRSSDGSLWVGSSEGLVRLEAGTIKDIYSGQGLPSSRIRSLYQDRSGIIWVGTEKGPAIYRVGRFEEPKTRHRLSVPIVAIGETPDGKVLFAADTGAVYAYADDDLKVLELQGNQSSLVRNIASIHNDHIISIHSDGDGLVWMGTDGSGLLLLRNGKLYRFLRTDGLFDGEIYGFASDSRGMLWMTCSKGLYSAAKSELLAFTDGKIRKIKCYPYVPLDGRRAIQGRPGVQPNVVAGTDGKLWVTTIEGLLSYDPNFRTVNSSAPPVLVEDVTISGQRRSPAASRLSGKDNVAFRYTGISFLAPQSVTFRYILDGYDRDWTNAGTRREAFYMNLPPGNFHFRVQACAPFVPCNEIGSAVDLQVTPYLYQRRWFWPLGAALLSVLIWLAHRLRIVRLQSQLALVVAERTRIARELHDTLIQGFAGITMQMQALSGRLWSSPEKQSLEDIIRDAGDCLRETRKSVAGLRDGEKTSPALSEAIAEATERITQDRDIRLVLNLDEAATVPAGTKHNLVRIAQEAVLNAARHATASTVEVSLLQTKEELRLSISDDGSGMAHPPERDTESQHYGIIGMKERAEHIGAEFDFSSTPGVGTTVTVRIVTGKKPSISLQQGGVKTSP